ncbi:MAG: peptidoglycan-binding protein [Actinomycetota bacterium]
MFVSPTRSTTSALRRLTRVAAVSTAAAVTVTTFSLSPTPIANAAPSPTAPVTTDRSAQFVGLKIGATGDKVKQLQQALIDSGVYVPGGVDGEFGAATEVAVSQFQRWNGLTDTGTVTKAMVDVLALGEGAAPAPAATTAPQAATTNPGNPANPFVGLQIGAQGNRVKELQQALAYAGVTVPGGADGVFGPATQAALRSYQERAGRSATGVVTADDVSALGLTPINEPAQNGYVGLEIGAQGDLVVALQQALLDAGISVPGGADGAFGPATKNALTIYQQSQGLTASGIVDGDTARALGLAAGDRGDAASTTPASTTHPYAGLKVGSSGDKVKELQRALIQAGLNLLGGADGVFGNYTKQTLQEFQRANGLEATGVLSSRGANILGLGTANAPQGVTTSQGGYPVYGERGDRVRALQQKLLAVGIVFDGGADGHFGAATAQAIIEYQRMQGLSVTGKVDQATADKLNLAKLPAPPAPTAQNVELSVFPMQGRCYYGDTWHAPRPGGRLHEGVDLIGAEGLLLYAVTDGTITRKYIDTPGSLAGNGVRLTQPDGTYYLYFHLSDFAPGIDVGSKVKAGDVIGYNGNTGNSATPHLHFEIHPNGGAAINPYPFVKAIDACDVTTPRS